MTTYKGYEYTNEEDEEMLLNIKYTYYPAYKGYREYGIPLEPDEDEGVEIEDITNENGDPVDLSETALKKLECDLLDTLRDECEDAWAEAKLDDMERYDRY